MKNWRELPAEQVLEACKRFMDALGDKADVVVTDFLSNPALTKRISSYAIKGGNEPSSSQVAARKIMGKNFFGVEEGIKYFQINPTRRQLSCFAEIPFSEKELIAHKDTHVLIAIFPISIIEIAKNFKNLFYNQETIWYKEESFAKDKGDIGWQLVKKTPANDSTGKIWREQRALLSENEEIPKAQTIVYTIIGMFLSTGERMFQKILVRCANIGSGGRHICIGAFDIKGLGISYVNDNAVEADIGSAVAEK